MKDNKSASLFQKEQVMESLKQSFVKLNPRVMIKNPIMVGSINSIFYFLHKAAEPFNCLEQDNLA